MLATPPAGTAAAAAGIQEGERVLTVDGHAVQSFSEMRLKMIDPIVERRPIVLEVEGPDGRHHRSIPTSGLPAGELERDFTRTLGVDLKAGLVQVASVEEGSAAARAGLQLGDQVLRVNGQPISRAQQLIQQVRASDDTKPLQLLVRRGNGEITVPVTPQLVYEQDAKDAGAPPLRKGRIGAGLNMLCSHFAWYMFFYTFPFSLSERLWS